MLALTIALVSIDAIKFTLVGSVARNSQEHAAMPAGFDYVALKNH